MLIIFSPSNHYAFFSLELFPPPSWLYPNMLVAIWATTPNLSFPSLSPISLLIQLFFLLFLASFFSYKIVCYFSLSNFNPLHPDFWICTSDSKLNKLKPQDSFGEFDKFFLDLQKVQEIIRKHHQTFLQLFGMTYCNAMLPNGKLSLCTQPTWPMAKCSGGLQTFSCFGYFLKMETFRSELLTGH